MKTSVLCIDDDPIFGLVVEKVLTNINETLDVVAKTSAESALNYLDSLDKGLYPSILIMDINLTKTNAFDLIKEIKGKGYPEFSTYLISSSLFPEDQIRANEEDSIRGIFKKPFTAESAHQILEENLLV